MFASLTPLSSSLLMMSSHGRLSAHHRRGVRHQDHRGQRSEDQAADLGHGGSGALQSRHAQLLQRSGGSADGVRHHQVRQASRRLSEAVMMETDVCVCVCVCVCVVQEEHIQPPQQLADRRQEPDQPQYSESELSLRT